MHSGYVGKGILVVCSGGPSRTPAAFRSAFRGLRMLPATVECVLGIFGCVLEFWVSPAISVCHYVLEFVNGLLWRPPALRSESACRARSEPSVLLSMRRHAVFWRCVLKMQVLPSRTCVRRSAFQRHLYIYIYIYTGLLSSNP